MFTFKQFIKESPNTYYGEAGGYLDDGGTISKPSEKYDVEEDLGDGLFSRRFNSPGSKPYMYRQEDHTGQNVHFVRGTRKEGAFVSQSTSKASWAGNHSEFYRNILEHEPKGIISDFEQTEGGKKTWRDLVHNHPDVVVTHHNEHTGAKIKLHTGEHWEKNFDKNGPQGRTYFMAKLKEKGKP